ncbi:hypothetical protein [Methyloversatilis discipulorum]|uniref:hypothetical protein n=1 Tax=Methyloversatilis discipulorum TaxID=1119528 RepID=UPI0003633232|nr:hypothetical protein [Methyloversatilis discipulorum]
MANHAFTPVRDFVDLLDHLRDKEAGPTVLSTIRFCELLGIDAERLAELAAVYGNATGMVSASEGAQCLIRASLRVLQAASDLNGDLGRTILWFRNEPLAPFGHQTAEHLVAEGRVEDVIRYLMALEGGVAG